MRATLILTSDGLTSQKIKDVYADLYQKGFKKVAIIVTADEHLKEKNRHAIEVKGAFEQIGYETCYIDIAVTHPKVLMDYDVIYFIGGNPFYLIQEVRRSGCEEVLRALLGQNKVISGASAGSMILGKNLYIPYEFTPTMGPLSDEELRGLEFTEVCVCPHYKRFLKSEEAFEQRLTKLENQYTYEITRISDGEAIVIKDEKVTYIK